MCRLTGVNKDSRILDECCGSGSFLVQAMVKVLADCRRGHTEEEYNALADEVKANLIFGIECEEKAYGLATTNMLMKRFAQFCKCIMIGDRGYGGVNLIEHINRIPGAEYLIRIKNNLWKEIQDLPLTDLDIEITINLRTTQTNADKEAYANGEAKWIAGNTDNPYKVGKDKKPKTWDFETPYQLKVRIVRFRISENTWETIATSLPKDEFPPIVLKYLYHLRWGIETSFRELKYAIGVTNFHARNRDSVLQEIFARLVMYNFCERITMRVVIRQDADRKWLYQANYTMGVHICRDFYRYIGEEPPDAEEMITHYILPIRPNRTDRRKVVPKQAVFFTYRVA